MYFHDVVVYDFEAYGVRSSRCTNLRSRVCNLRASIISRCTAQSRLPFSAFVFVTFQVLGWNPNSVFAIRNPAFGILQALLSRCIVEIRNLKLFEIPPFSSRLFFAFLFRLFCLAWISVVFIFFFRARARSGSPFLLTPLELSWWQMMAPRISPNFGLSFVTLSFYDVVVYVLRPTVFEVPDVLTWDLEFKIYVRQ